jgi:hypothetical protein
MISLVLRVVLLAAAVGAQDAPMQQTTSGKFTVRVTNVTRARTFQGRVQTRSPDLVFLTVGIETSDPCFNWQSDDRCFSPPQSGLDKVRIACGSVEDEAGKKVEADGGGTLESGMFCNYIVPVTMGVFTLRLSGYPEIKNLK